jgi:hypothetical protein
MIVLAANTAFENIGDAELPSNVTQVYVLASEL